MVKVEIPDAKPVKPPIALPAMFRSRRNGQIVLFLEPQEGFRLHHPTHHPFEYVTCWVPCWNQEDWEPLAPGETVTLTQG